MHELGLAQQTLEIALEALGGQGARQVVSMRLRIGGLSGVVPEALQFALETIAEGTSAEGARIIIEEIAPICRCDSCRNEYEVVDFSYTCPQCGSSGGQITRGREMALVSLEVT